MDRARKKNLARPLRKQLSHFACPRLLLLEDASPGLWPIGQLSFNSYLPSKKIYLSRNTGRDVFRALAEEIKVKILELEVQLIELGFKESLFQPRYQCSPLLVSRSPREREREDNGERENPGNGVIPFTSMYPDKLVITKGYGVRTTTTEGPNAFAPSLCFG